MNAAFDERHEQHPWYWLHQRLHHIEQTLKNIMATQAELAADLKAVLAQQQKTAGEIAAVQASVDTLKAQIVDLEGQIATGGTVSQELVDAVAAVKAQAQIVDDLIPDVATPPPAPVA
jgi:peptidoglycan hydrolase CwlO-like protein